MNHVSMSKLLAGLEVKTYKTSGDEKLMDGSGRQRMSCYTAL